MQQTTLYTSTRRKLDKARVKILKLGRLLDRIYHPQTQGEVSCRINKNFAQATERWY